MTTTMTAVAHVDLDPDLPGRIAVWSDFRLKDAVKAVPGARWSSEHRRWTTPLTWPACIGLRAQLGSAMTIGPALSEWAFETRAAKKALQDAHFRLEPTEWNAEWDDLPGFAELFPYQKVGGQSIMTAESYLLFDETGTGKSRTALAGLALAKANGEVIFPALVVAPKSMLVTWQREFARFFDGIDIRVAAGTPSKVKEALEPGGDVYIVSYDTLRRYSRLSAFPTVKLTDDEKLDKELNRINWASVVADECHRVKNPTSKQTRALWHVGDGARYRLGLTGTPIQDTLEDLWAILRYVAPDEYPTKTSFIERYALVDYNIWGGREIRGLNPLHATEFEANAHTRFRRVTKEVALPFLPPKMYEIRWVTLPPKMRKAYDSMVKMLVAEMEGGTVLEAKSVLERAGRLTQLANASGSVDADGTFHMELPSPKVDAFIEDVMDGDFNGQQVVVFSDSRQLIELCATEMEKRKLKFTMITGGVVGDERQAAMDAFQAGEVQFILLTRAGGEGITLTAASVMVRLFRSWSFIVHRQSEDRVHRIGSERHESVTYVDYITEGTVEEGQLARLAGKDARSEEVLRDRDLLDMIKGTYAVEV